MYFQMKTLITAHIDFDRSARVIRRYHQRRPSMTIHTGINIHISHRIISIIIGIMSQRFCMVSPFFLSLQTQFILFPFSRLFGVSLFDFIIFTPRLIYRVIDIVKYGSFGKSAYAMHMVELFVFYIAIGCGIAKKKQDFTLSHFYQFEMLLKS